MDGLLFHLWLKIISLLAQRHCGTVYLLDKWANCRDTDNFPMTRIKTDSYARIAAPIFSPAARQAC